MYWALYSSGASGSLGGGFCTCATTVSRQAVNQHADCLTSIWFQGPCFLHEQQRICRVSGYATVL